MQPKLEHFYFKSKKLLVNYMDELYTKEKFKATRMTSYERVQQTARNRHCHQAIHPSLMGLWNQENLPQDPDVTVLARWGWKFQIWGIGIWHTRRSLQKTCLPLLRSRGGFLCGLWKKFWCGSLKFVCTRQTMSRTASTVLLVLWRKKAMEYINPQQTTIKVNFSSWMMTILVSATQKNMNQLSRR